jgi:hypothetical protein
VFFVVGSDVDGLIGSSDGLGVVVVEGLVVSKEERDVADKDEFIGRHRRCSFNLVSETESIFQDYTRR